MFGNKLSDMDESLSWELAQSVWDPHLHTLGISPRESKPQAQLHLVAILLKAQSRWLLHHQ